MENQEIINEEKGNDVNHVLCGVIFHRPNDIDDISGCLKPFAHNDAHICKSSDGKYYEWEDDYECKCGCWDECEGSNGMEKPCAVYSEVPPYNAL